MSEQHRVGLVARHVDTRRDQKARAQLVEALPNAECAAFDPDTGAFEVTLEAESQEDAIRTVRDAIAATGTDDHIQLAEHGPPRLT